MSARRSSPRATARLRRAPLTRSSSLLGTLKSIVAAPLTWFTSGDDVHDAPGEKRPRRSQPLEKDGQQGAERDAERKIKRKRFHSPEPEALPRPTQHYQPDRSAYLDPPQSLLSKRSANTSSASANYLRSSTVLPPTSARHQQRNRLSLSPRPTTSHGKPSGIARTQSMDPPSRLLAPPRATRPPPLSRDASMMSIDEPPSSPISPIGDVSMSPSRPRFKLRTSLTPQPSGSDFGPTPFRRERDPSEPPPLEALMENPIFVKGPPKPQPPQRQPSLTLGSLAETHRSALPLARQRSNLTIAPQSSSSELSRNSTRPINAAELALHELEVYKTPLIPSRLRGSAALPDMFRPKKAIQRTAPPLLMNGDRDQRPRLGLSDFQGGEKHEESGKGKKTKGAGAKPYEGQGGMKKLLARRRMEEEEEREKEQEAAIVTDEERAGNNEKTEAQKKLAKDLEFPLLVRASEPPTTLGGRPQSSLRVGRTRTGRSHVPAARPNGKNRFSAVYEDDDGDDAMSLGGDGAESSQDVTLAPAEVQMYEAPKGFSFASSVTPAQQGTAEAKEPPIPALPFSLTAKPVYATTAAPQVGTVPQATAPASAHTPLPSVPSISLIPPSPAAADKEKETVADKEKPADASGLCQGSVPDFFSKSTIFNKPSAKLPFSLTPALSAPAVPTGGFSRGPTAEKKTEAATPAPSIFTPTPSADTLGRAIFGAPAQTTQTNAAPAQPSFGVSVAAESAQGPPVAPTAASLLAKPASDMSSSLFGGGSSAAASSAAPLFDGSKDVASAVFGAPPKLSDATVSPVSSAFSFSVGTPAKPAEALKVAPTPAPPSFSFGAPLKLESSDTKKLSTTPSPSFPPSTSAHSPLFIGFGTQISTSVTSPSAVEASKSSFTVGQPVSSAPSSATVTSPPAIDAPKPLFGNTLASATTPTLSFTFSASQGTPVPEASAPAKSPFTFGVSAPSTPNPEKKPAFVFGAPTPAAGPTTPTVAAPISLFGAPSGGTNGADVSKGFAFGTSTPVRPVTPPQRNDNEVNMDESPTRGAGMDLNGSGSTPKPTLTAFGFGNNPSGTSSPFGRPAQGGPSFGFGSSSSSSGSNPFAKPEIKPAEKPSLSFSGFGQQSTSPSSSAPFGFGITSATQPAQSSSSSGGAFGFGTPAPTPTSVASPFAFGAPAPSTSGLFGQPSSGAPGATPTSPAFPSPSNPFGFGAPAVAPTSAPSQSFSFSGSQPVSPAPSSAGLPSTQSGGFTFSQSTTGGGSTGSPSPFGGNAPLPPTSGGSLFTMGSAPPPVVGGARPVKKLPSRRAGKR